MFSTNLMSFSIAVLLLLISSAQHVMAAADLSYQTSEEGGEWRLAWDQDLAVDVEQDGRELILRFNYSLGEIDLASLQKAFPGLIESARYGYDSLMVRVAPHVEQHVLVRKKSVSVRLTLVSTDEPLCPQGQLSAAARLRYLAALAQLELGDLEKARTELHALRKDCPDSGEVQAALGRVEERAGRWFIALDHYEKAGAAEFSQHTDAEKALRRKHDAHAEFKLLRVEDKQDSRRVSKLFTFKQRMADDQRIDLRLSHHDVHLADAPGDTGNTDLSMQEGRFSLEDVMGERNLQTFALSFLPGVVGGGYHYQYLADDARTDFSAEINALDDTDIGRMAQEGRRDVVSLEQMRYRSDLLSLTYGMDIVRYHGVSDQHYWAGGYTATVDYHLLQSPVDVFAKYVLDGENVSEKAPEPGERKADFVPEDFENHSLAGVVSAPCMNQVQLTLELGYTWDRLGGEGPYQSLQIQPMSDAWVAYGVGVRHGQRDNSAADDDVLEAEFTLQVPF